MAHFIIKSMVALCMLSTVMADCYHGYLQESWKDGRREQYCLTQEVKPQVVQYEETLTTDDCYRCRCDSTGLRCCGFGIKAGTNAQSIPAPHGCKVVLDKCDYYFVDARTNGPCLG